jgi:hypothetical protein
MKINNLRFKIVLLFTLLATAGCATTPKEQVPFKGGARVETLTSAVTISVKGPNVSTGGRGYMLFQRPDSFHLVMLTPFGTTALETFSAEDRITIIIPSKGKAYTGRFSDMPPDSPLQGWRMIRLMASDESFFDPTKQRAVEKKSREFGETTSYYDAKGLLEREVFGGGEEVSFHDYISAEGVPFPGVIEFKDNNGSKVKVTFDEPEVNKPLAGDAMTPKLDGITLLPLESFKGI